MNKANIFDKIIDKIGSSDVLTMLVGIVMSIFLFGTAVSCWAVDSHYSALAETSDTEIEYDAIESINEEIAKPDNIGIEVENEEIEDVEEETEEVIVAPEVTEPIEPEVTEPVAIYYDVPLSQDLQDYIFKLCEERGIDPTIVIAIIELESKYDSNALGDRGRSQGLMQIQPRWHQARMAKLNCSNLLNPYENVTVGIDILAELYETGNSEAWVLMVYNGGYGYANSKIARGEVSDYAITVMNRSKTLIKV